MSAEVRPRPTVVRGRYAPSPTGRLHLGNARTALLAWLHVRSQGGRFVLRVEDLDRQRSSAEAASALLEDLRWLGLDWDEGPDVGGPFGPYTQSERQGLYESALGHLRDQGLLYPCYCSRAELRSDLAHVAGAPHPGEEGPPYAGTCRGLTPAERAAREVAGRRPSWRFLASPGTVCYNDGLAGRVCQDVAASVGDFVVQRADGVVAYQLAVVVDDAAMGITNVLRGADLVSSTPRQLLLYQALGLTPPAFAHAPLLYGPDGARLSKRHGDTSLAMLRATGIPPAVVTGYLAWLSGLVPRGTAVPPHALVS
ncbi:MAG: tRNA glutamyl-Q(34) synthetase GluQRS, partial [Bacillota bacterium]